MFFVLDGTSGNLLRILLNFFIFVIDELKRSFCRNGICITSHDEWWVGAIVRINVFQPPVRWKGLAHI